MRADAGVSAAPRDRAFYEERRRAKARAARRRRRIAVAAGVALIALPVGVGAGFAGSADRIAEGVTIAGVDVSGMSAEEAKRALEQRAATVAEQPVVFTLGGQVFELTPAKLGLTADWDAAVRRALEAGDGFILIRGFQRLKLRFSGTDVGPEVRLEEAAVEKQLDRIAAKIDRAPREAAIVLEGLEPTIVPAETGVALDRARAADLLASALAGFARGSPVSLPVRVAQPAVRAPQLEPVLEEVRAALSAPVRLTLGRKELTLEPEELATLLVLPARGSRELSIGGEAADRYFARVAKEVERRPRDADFELTSGGRVRIVPSLEGRVLDVKATERALLAAALAVSPADRSAKLAVATAEPKLSTADARAMGIVDVVASYTTQYGGDPNRIHNVQLVSTLIDDHLIAPGAVFSFNDTTGERNAEKGFLEAPVIINGELETGLGGGVCQVSTTVFNTAYEAGLPILERTNHALYIGHYPLARDATVNYPDIDLKFKNDTGHWLWLRTFVGASSLTVNLYGTPVDRRVVSETTPLEVIGKPSVKRVLDPSLEKGRRIVEDPGEPRRSTSVHRIVYDGEGNVLYDATWFSIYRAEPKIVRIGTKPKPKEEPPKGAGGSKPSESGGQGSGGSPAAGEEAPPPVEEPPSSGGGTAEPPPPPA